MPEIQTGFEDILNNPIYFNRVFDESPESEIVWCTDGKIIKANKSFCKLTGYDPGKINSLDFWEFSEPDGKEEELDILATLGLRNRSDFYEKSMRHENGNYITVRVFSIPVEQINGRGIYHSLIQEIQITDRPNVEAERTSIEEDLKKQNENLERKIQDQTKDLQQKTEEISLLNLEQAGDHYLISLINGPLSVNENKSELCRTEFYIEQKNKFKFRNKEAGIGGDICITSNLRFGDGLDRHVLVFNADAMGKSVQGAGGAIVAGTAMHNILIRSTRNNRVLNSTPEEWITEVYHELDSVFRAFNGSTAISCFLGIINEKTGDMWYFNAGHPFTVLYRDKTTSFIEHDLSLHKLGQISEHIFHVQIFQLFPGDVIVSGSDGRDSIDLSRTINDKIINEDEELFLDIVQKSEGVLDKLISVMRESGKPTDDLSLFRIGFQENDRPIDEKISHRHEHTTPSTILEDAEMNYKSGSFGIAAEKYEEYLLQNPDDVQVMVSLGICYKKLRDFSKSVGISEAAENLDPDNLMNLVNLADNFRLLGVFGKSRNYLDRALGLGPENRSAMKLNEILKSKGF